MSALTSEMRRQGSSRPLGELATQIRESILPDKSDERPYLALEHIDTGDVVARRQGTSAEIRSTKFVFRRGDVLYGKLRPYLDKAVLAQFEGLSSTELLVLRARPDVDPQFLAFAMHSRRVQKHAIDTTAGVNHPRTSWESLRTLDIYCPPIEEQRRIAGILSTIQRACESMEAELRAFISVGRAVRLTMFQAAAGRTLLLQDLLGEPLRNGYSPVADPNGTVRVLTLSAVTYDAFVESNTKRALMHPRMANLWLQPGDILVERANTREFVGTAALYRGDRDWAIYPDLMIRVRPNRAVISPELLSEYLHLPHVRKYFQQRARGTSGSMPKIDHEILANLPVIVPQPDEQPRMTRAFRAVQASKSSAQTQLKRARDLFNSTIRQLMEPTR